MRVIYYNVGISVRSRNRIWTLLRPGGRRPMPTDAQFGRMIEKLMREALDARDANRKVTS